MWFSSYGKDAGFLVLSPQVNSIHSQVMKLLMLYSGIGWIYMGMLI